MHPTRSRLKALALALAAALGLLAACKQEPKQRVLLISIDGFRWDYRARFATPALDQLAAAGVSAEKLQPAFPTKTFPNHFTLVTGLVPDHHGIVSNTMKEGDEWFMMSNRAAVTDPKWWQADPIWTTLEKSGRKTAPLLWPGSEAAIGGMMPAYWVQYQQDLTDAERVDLLTAFYSKPESEWPDFATLYWHDVDTAGHGFGPGSDEVKAAAEKVDRAIGQLQRTLASLGAAKSLNVIVVSDHGMSQLAADRVIYLEDYVDINAIETVDSSPTIGILPKTLTVEEIYGRLAGKHASLHVYRKHEMPSHLAYGRHPRVPPIVIMAADGWTIVQRRPPPDQPPRRFGGAHGYDNALDSMQGLFVAAGPAFRGGVKVDRFRAVDVYELMCRILDVQPNKNDGDSRAVLPLLKASR